MLCSVSAVLFAATLVSSSAIVRRADPTWQTIPSTGKADGTFKGPDTKPADCGDPPACPTSSNYGAFSGADIPFGRLYGGSLNYFRAGQLNTPNIGWDVSTDQGGVDSAKQSACGIPDNAFFDSKVAIHPYFLKYADLSRYCMQDVCISFWSEDWGTDMMLKVTDICDPAVCKSPGDIQISRTKYKVWSHQGQIGDNSKVKGIEQPVAPNGTVWFFMKCWADGLVSPGYTDNWFAQPPLANNLKWAQAQQTQQYKYNQDAYPANEKYENMAYHAGAVAPPITDWKEGDVTPSYAPLAGGQGFGKGGGKGPASGGLSSNSTSGATSPASSLTAPVQSQGATGNTGQGGSDQGPASVVNGGASSSLSSPAAGATPQGDNEGEGDNNDECEAEP